MLNLHRWLLFILLIILPTTSVQANDLLKKCDFNKNWKIDTRKTYKIDWVPKNIAKKETKCSLNFENAQLDKENAQLDKENAQLDKENAQLDKENAQWRIVLAKLDMTIKNLKEELRIVEEKLKKSKEGLKKSKEGLKKSKEERQKKRQWLIWSIKKIKCNVVGSSNPPSKAWCEKVDKELKKLDKLVGL